MLFDGLQPPEAIEQTQRRRWAAICCACRANIPALHRDRCGEGLQVTTYGKLRSDSLRFKAAAPRVRSPAHGLGGEAMDVVDGDEATAPL